MNRIIGFKGGRIFGNSSMFDRPKQLMFYTNWDTATDGNFTASLTTSDASTVTWVMPDGTEIQNNSLNTSNSSLNGATNQIQIKDASKVVSLTLDSCKIVGALDLSEITFNGAFNCRINPNLTSIAFSNANTFTSFEVRQTGLAGTLDLTSGTFTGSLRAYENSSLTSITFPTATQNIGDLNIRNNDLQGDIDLTMLNISGKFYGSTNPDITSVSHSNNSHPTLYWLNSCNVDTINLGSVGLDNLSDFRMNNNNFDEVGANSFFQQLDDNSTSTAATVNFTGNTSPTGGSTNTNIVSIVAKGGTVLL
ncbi:MAG: hypothetical protein ACPGJS_05685 [Flammeovirgaceae bacterium]